MSEAPRLNQDEIMTLVCGEEHDGYRMVSNDDTGEEWRHGSRHLTVITRDGETFWALERRVTLDGDWDHRSQPGPEYLFHRVVPVSIVKTVYRTAES